MKFLLCSLSPGPGALGKPALGPTQVGKMLGRISEWTSLVGPPMGHACHTCQAASSHIRFGSRKIAMQHLSHCHEIKQCFNPLYG